MLFIRFFCCFLLFCLVLPSTVLAKLPNDPQAEQWAYEHIGVYDAWNTTVGSRDVVVAIIDNGFDTFHPDLVDNVWKNEDEIPDNKRDDDNNGYIDDVWGWNFMAEDRNKNGEFEPDELGGSNDPRPSVDGVTDKEKAEGIFDHGTIVAGLIGARGDNSIDGAGINWRVRLMNLKVLGNEGIGSILPLARAIRYAVDNGAQVINISMVGPEDITDVSDAVNYAYQKNVIVVAAAGNGSVSLNLSPHYPICTDAGKKQSVLGVSAITEEHRITNFSNVGSQCIDITAPGKDLASTIRFSPTNGLVERYGKGYSGTSFATPLVSGAAALIKSIQPTWTPDQVMGVLFDTAHHTPNQNESVYADLFGKGLLKIDRAIQLAATSPNAVNVASTTTAVASPVYENIDPSVTAFPVLWAVDTKQGVIHSYTGDEKNQEEASRPELKGLEDMTVFDHLGTPYIATIKRRSGSQKTVTIYNEAWKPIKTWRVALSVPAVIAAANVLGDTGTEIVIGPRGKSKLVYSLYSFEGKKLAATSLSYQHTGVSFGFLKEGTYASLYVLFKQKKGFGVSVYDDKGKERRSFLLPQMRTLGSIGFGDMDMDGDMEFIVTTGKGQGPEIGVYTKEGALFRSFSQYDSSVVGGLAGLVVDYDRDGKQDVLTLPLHHLAPLYRFNGQAQRVQEWPNRGKTSQGYTHLFLAPWPLTK